MDAARRLAVVGALVGGLALAVALYHSYRDSSEETSDAKSDGKQGPKSAASKTKGERVYQDAKKSIDSFIGQSIAQSRSLLHDSYVPPGSSSSSSSAHKQPSSGDLSDTSSVTSADEKGLIKGYKTLRDGRKTSYFSREISEADKRLLGDSTPQKISALSNPNHNPNPGPSPSHSSAARDASTPVRTPPQSGGSKWNKAGTYEERDLRAWGKQTMEQMLAYATCESADGRMKATICNVKVLECDCSISFARSKKRYVYDMALSCDFIGKVLLTLYVLSLSLSLSHTHTHTHTHVLTLCSCRSERGRLADHSFRQGALRRRDSGLRVLHPLDNG